MTGKPAASHVVAAFASIYVFWGATYLAIRIGVATLPPFLMAGTRFLAAGVILYAILWARGRPHPPARLWAAAAIPGGLLLLGGNGLVSWAEQEVESGFASLIIGSIPLWVAVLGLATGWDRRIDVRGAAGILIGFLGLAVLLAPAGDEAAIDAWHAVVLLAAALSWSVGTLLQPRIPRPPDLLQGITLQMLTGGFLLSVVGLAAGEAGQVHAAAFTAAAVGAWVYLVVLGTLVAFTAFVWLLHHVPAPRVATYAYVNPVIAVLLGWAVADEAVTPRLLLGGLVVVLGVALTLSGRGRPGPRRTEGARDTAGSLSEPAP